VAVLLSADPRIHLRRQEILASQVLYQLELFPDFTKVLMESGWEALEVRIADRTAKASTAANEGPAPGEEQLDGLFDYRRRGNP